MSGAAWSGRLEGAQEGSTLGTAAGLSQRWQRGACWCIGPRKRRLGRVWPPVWGSRPHTNPAMDNFSKLQPEGRWAQVETWRPEVD